MAISGLLFILWRIAELITLIPPIGMLSYFIHGYIAANELTPNFILVLFIVVVLAGVWVLATLLLYAKARHAGLFVALIDLGFFAALIAGVVVLNGINAQNCNNFDPSSYIGISLGPFAYDLGNACGLLKASYAFAIMNIIFFFITFVLALLIARHHRKEDQGTKEKTNPETAEAATADTEGAGWAEMDVGIIEIIHHGATIIRDEMNRGGTTADKGQTSDL